MSEYDCETGSHPYWMLTTFRNQYGTTGHCRLCWTRLDKYELDNCFRREDYAVRDELQRAEIL